MKNTLRVLIASTTLAAALPASAQIVADFTTPGTYTENLFTDAAADTSSGWATAGWLLKRNADITSVAINRNVIDTTPLVAGGGNYLSVSTTNTHTGGLLLGVARQYAPLVSTDYNGVIRNQDHSISFDFRVDELTNFTGGNFTIGDAANTTVTNGLSSASAWWLRAHAVNTGSALAGKWAVYNGPRNGTFNAANYIDTGVDFAVGVTYTISINLEPETRDWTMSINGSNGQEFISGTLGFRTSAFSPTGILSFFRESAAVGSVTSFSIDNISIIPEPSSFAALAGLGVLGLAATRRRSRA